MKIIIDARNMNSSTGRYAERLVHYLEELDTTNDYIVLMLQKDIDFYKPTNPKFKVIGVSYKWYSLSEQFGMARFLYSLNADLVFFTMPHHPIFYFRPYITMFHDLILLNTYNSDKNYFVFKAKQFVGRFVYHAMIRGAKRIITPTKYVRQELLKFSRVNPSKVVQIYEGCDVVPGEFEIYQPLVDKQFIMYLGQQSDYKNIRRLMLAHQKLRGVHPDLLLVLVGRLSGKNSPPLVKNREWASKQGLEGIVFTDFLPDPQAQWVKQHCQAYVFPSLMEGFGLPALEAMAVGAPVVSSNATCLPEVYGNAAHYFDPQSVDDMTRAINDVLADQQLRNQLIKNGTKQSQKYTWKKMAEQTLVVIDDVLTTLHS